MRPDSLRFTADCAPFLEELMALSGTRPLGTEIYTYCSLLRETSPQQLWAGIDGGGRLAGALLDQGRCRTLLLPDAAAVGQSFPDEAGLFCRIPARMRYRVLLREQPAFSADGRVRRAQDADSVMELLTLLHGRPPIGDETARYVYFARAANAGFSDVFFFSEADGTVCGCAQILAKNRRYALIGNVYTVPAKRGQGVAAALLAACETLAAEEGLLPVLYCEAAMTSYYRAHGYRIVRKHEL